jgi:hypothetical protein
MDVGGGVLADALKHIDQVVIGIDAVQTTGDDQALDDADMLGAELGPGRTSTHGDPLESP